jgi:hypothetical protein
MIHLHLVRAAVDADGRPEAERVGEVRVDAGVLEITPDGVLSTDMPVVSVRTGDTVHAHEDPEEWARSLSGSLRGVGLAVEVIEDTDPLPELAEEDEEEPLGLPDHTPSRKAVAW